MNKTILLVEPNPDSAARKKKFLEDFGHLVQVATTRRDALGNVKSFDPGLVISAFTLPDGDAFALAEDLRIMARSQAPLLVAASAKQIQHYRNRPGSSPIQGWLKQPVEQMGLYNLVNEWLGQSVTKEPVPQGSVVTEPTPPPKPAPPRPASETDEGEGGPKPSTTVHMGNLDRTPVARLFHRLGERALTGVLTFTHAPTRISVHLQNGYVVNVLSSYIPELSLGVMLAKKQSLTPQELAGVRHKWEREGGLFGKVLLDLELISEKELNQALVYQRVKKLVHLFSWNWCKGTYKFEGDPEKVAPLPGFKLPFEQIITAGVRTYYDLDRLLMVFDKHDRMNCPVKLSYLEPEKLVSKSDLDSLRAAIEAIQHYGNLAEAGKKCDLPQINFLQFAYALHVMDLLTFVEKTPA